MSLLFSSHSFLYEISVVIFAQYIIKAKQKIGEDERKNLGKVCCDEVK
jgi:hypothetical protein